MNTDYDLVIVGGGPAGLTAAGFAMQLGASVAIVEKNRIGGDCTWYGCVPSKALLKAAKVAHTMRSSDRFGLESIEPIVDLKQVMAHVQSVVNDVYQHESPDVLRADGIGVFIGDCRFLDPHTIAVDDVFISAKRFLIATGAHPFVPPISGLDTINYLTYESLWTLEKLPEHLVVLGGGPIGCEMAQAFRRLGAKITIVEGEERILLRDDPAVSEVLAGVFESEGIDLKLSAKAEHAWQDGNDIHLIAGGDEIVCDNLLVAIGRRPNVDGLDFEKSGVKYSPKGIEVDDHLRTSQSHIYAAGDCIGGYQFTHYAGWQAFMAVRNALLPGAVSGISEYVPWTTFTDPEVAHIGMSEAEAKEEHGDNVMTCNWPMDKVDRARTEGNTTGFIKLVHKKDGALLGATIVAGRAGEMIHEWVLALKNGMKVGDIAEMIHVYPTYSTASMQASADVRVSQLLSGTSGKVIRGLAHLIR
jgi:pyruvate/2-oxoglutarate dehydrogenase complex dihydrolipoamide dehydrogenase (E3) component